ncbi:protein NLRC3-like isoform X2 [Dysidea avara]|uniref:protein NLRC3-like isoform X2 n=1 Tax=Dysidea avara TaxID=196820 RepID=UPI00332CE002
MTDLLSDKPTSHVSSPSESVCKDELTALSEKFSKRYKSTRFAVSVTDQPYASNLTKKYIHLTFVQCSSRKTQEQLLSTKKEHCTINIKMFSDFEKHLPLANKLNVYSSAGDRATKNIEDLFVLPNSSARPKCVLVEGAPGIGKTELVKEIAYCWAEDKLLTDFKIVFVLRLRDPKVQKINSVKNLIFYFVNKELISASQGTQAVEQLCDSQDDVLFLLDGFDECQNKLQEDSFILRLIDCDILPHSKILITSRPSGSYRLHKVVDSIFEIHGFDKEDQSLFISRSFEGLPEKKGKFQDFLSVNMIIDRYCSIPLYLTIMIFLFKQNCLPKTLTEAIEKIVLYTIHQNLSKMKVIPSKLGKIADLPAEYYEVVCQLSKIALDGVNTNQLVFTLDEIEKTCPTIKIFNNGLGLLQAVEHFPESGAVGHDISVNFIHYSMQEFLAAYHITRLPDEEQHSLMKEPYNDICICVNSGVTSLRGALSLWHNQNTNMWLMYVGLTGGESVAFNKFVQETESLHDGNQIQGDQMKLLLLFRYYTEVNNDKMCRALLDVFDINNTITLGSRDWVNHQIALYPHHMLSLALLLSQTSTNHCKSLKLLNTLIPQDSFNILGNYFERVNRNVDCLYLKKNWLLPPSAIIIAAIIKTNCLKTLAIVDNPIKISKEISDALSCSSIRSLVLSNVDMTSDDVCILLKGLTMSSTIELLDISANTLGRKGAIAIAEFLNTNRTLLSLNISHSKPVFGFPGENVDETAQEHTSHVSLLYALQHSPTLTSLDVSEIMLACFGVSYIDLIIAILGNRKLQSLHFGSSCLCFEIANMIANFISFNSSLVSLDISKNSMYDVGMKIICGALHNVTNVKLLDISENFLSIDSARMIANILRHSTTLICLALGSNKISDEGCQYVADALFVNKTLTSLYIRNNMICDDGAKALAAALTNNTTLLQLDLSFNDIQDDGAMALINAFHASSTLKWLFVAFNPMCDIKTEECLVSYPDVTIDDKYCVFCNGFLSIPVASAQFISHERHFLFIQKECYNEWKQNHLGQISLQDVYNSFIPEDQQDCLKYYIQKQFGKDPSDEDPSDEDPSDEDPSDEDPSDEEDI